MQQVKRSSRATRPAVWKNANATLHEHLLAVLKGNGKAFKTQDGKVVIDLIPVLVEVLQRIDQRTDGLLSQHLPALNEDLTPDQVRAKISTALGRPIPDDFGTIEVFDASQLTAVPRAVQWFQQGVVAFVVLAVLLIGAALLGAPDRRRIAIWLGLGAAVTFVIFRSPAARSESRSSPGSCSQEPDRGAGHRPSGLLELPDIDGDLYRASGSSWPPPRFSPGLRGPQSRCATSSLEHRG